MARAPQAVRKLNWGIVGIVCIGLTYSMLGLVGAGMAAACGVMIGSRPEAGGSSYVPGYVPGASPSFMYTALLSGSLGALALIATVAVWKRVRFGAWLISFVIAVSALTSLIEIAHARHAETSDCLELAFDIACLAIVLILATYNGLSRRKGRQGQW